MERVVVLSLLLAAIFFAVSLAQLDENISFVSQELSGISNYQYVDYNNDDDDATTGLNSSYYTSDGGFINSPNAGSPGNMLIPHIVVSLILLGVHII